MNLPWNKKYKYQQAGPLDCLSTNKLKLEIGSLE